MIRVSPSRLSQIARDSHRFVAVQHSRWACDSAGLQRLFQAIPPPRLPSPLHLLHRPLPLLNHSQMDTGKVAVNEFHERRDPTNDGFCRWIRKGEEGEEGVGDEYGEFAVGLIKLKLRGSGEERIGDLLQNIDFDSENTAELTATVMTSLHLKFRGLFCF